MGGKKIYRNAGKLIREAAADVKMAMEDLLEGKSIETIIEEEIVFDWLDDSSEAIFSLLLASGYLKVEGVPEADDEADVKLDYLITSNRESELGRYDVLMEPKNGEGYAYIFEFKVKEPYSENTLEETLQSALRQM